MSITVKKPDNVLRTDHEQRSVVELRIHFWPLLIGALVLVWGIATITGQVLGIRFDISWWAIIAVIIGLWILSHAIHREPNKP